jgi:hypothetical protein
MAVIVNGTAGIQNNATDLSYTGTLTGSTGVVNLGSGQFYKDASGNVGIGTSSPVNYGKFAVVAADGYISASVGSTTALTQYISSDVAFICAAPSSGSNGKQIVFQTGSSGLGTERMRIDASGNLLVGKTSAGFGNSGVEISGNTAGNQQYWTGTNDLTKTLVGAGLGTGGSYASHLYYFNNTSTIVGYIAHTNATTSYLSVSDYRLKENVAPMTGALAKVVNLKPCTYTWKADGSEGQGFIAHELQDVVPDAVTGVKDAVQTVDDLDADGKKIGTKEVPQYQGVDTSFLVATLTAAIQELKAIIDIQAERIAALEAA